MIQIKPEIRHESDCPYCGKSLIPERVLWQGIHVCAVCRCPACGAEIIDDLACGHSLHASCRVDLKAGKLFLDDIYSRSWFGNPFLESLLNPREDLEISLTVEIFKEFKTVVVLNCIDFLYGHSLLKLLNAEAHLDGRDGYGLVVIIPRFLRWMVPSGVAEVWTVNIPLAEARNYYPDLDRLVHQECRRFEEVFLSPAHSHPGLFDITRFTGVEKHDFTLPEYRITFIWREDRPWLVSRLWVRASRRSRAVRFLLLQWQNYKIINLFSRLRKSYSEARFTVAGLGETTSFPPWIDDRRTGRFDDATERELCRIYAESRLVIGVHGSNMLLPSAHAGLVIELVPEERWSNFAQDLLIHEEKPLIASYRFRLLPLQTSLRVIARIAYFQLRDYLYYKRIITHDFHVPGTFPKGDA
jgi:hypothetical protein